MGLRSLPVFPAAVKRALPVITARRILAAVIETLRRYFGFGEFRGGQEAVIRTLLEGRPALAVFPTGGGKSLCYQLPALMLDGLTLVISPLIALMKDQVDGLVVRGIPAARLDSTLDAGEAREIYEKLARGELKLLYVAPERLANEGFRKRAAEWRIALVAIDEAHCISGWGHNFRPDYLKLAKFCRSLKVERVLALTATATPKVAGDIRRHFRISTADHVQLSFHRPNLDLRVTPCAARERKPILLDRLGGLPGAAVVYVTRQETAEEVATFLAANGLAARAYHAGLTPGVRSDAQREFMEGRVRVIVATIAFGMGIDKADIRQVIHHNLPKSLENHMQEIGRAGRDGLPAVCEMLACGEDLTVLENFIHADAPSRGALGNLIDRVLRLGERFDVSIYDLSVTCDIRPAVISTVLVYLELAGIIAATGSFYDTYRVRPVRSFASVLAGRGGRERPLVTALIESGEMKREWLHLRPAESAVTLGISRERVVALLGELEAGGEVALAVAGSRQGFQLKKDPGPLAELADRLAVRFAEREAADLERLAEVLGLSARRGCLTGYLTEHFGEKLPLPCGHCDRCRGVPAKIIRRPKPRMVSDGELEAIRRLAVSRHAALGTPRQLARFLCGMTSPATTRARLTRSDEFGLLADLPFAEVLRFAEAV